MTPNKAYDDWIDREKARKAVAVSLRSREDVADLIKANKELKELIAVEKSRCQESQNRLGVVEARTQQEVSRMCERNAELRQMLADVRVELKDAACANVELQKMIDEK